MANLEAALHSVAKQDLSRVETIHVYDNDTQDDVNDILGVIESFDFGGTDRSLTTYKHDDRSKTHSWSTNAAVSLAVTPWVLFTRADYLLHPNLLDTFVGVVDSKPSGWDGFVTSNARHLHVDIASCESIGWREEPSRLRAVPGTDYDYTKIDAGVWMARRDSFERVDGLDERLTAWGHAQTHFQWKLHQSGTEFVRVPEVLFFHPAHGGEKDIVVAHRQLEAIGVDVRQMWERHEGAQPYK